MIEQALSTDPNYMPKFKNEVVRITKYTYKNYLYIDNTKRQNLSPLTLFIFNSNWEEGNFRIYTYT